MQALACLIDERIADFTPCCFTTSSLVLRFLRFFQKSNMTEIDAIKLCLIHCIKQFLVFHLIKIGLMVKKHNKCIGGAKVPNSD